MSLASTLMTRSRRRSFITAATLILFAALALRVWNLDTQSLWHDEAWSVFSGYGPFAPMGIRGSDYNAPWAYYSSLALWVQMTGDSVWSMRAWSALLGTLTVAVTMLVARRFFGKPAALLSGLLVAVNPILWVFSQEIRAYVTMPLAALLLLPLVVALLRHQKRIPARIWLGIAVVEILALYAHNLAVPLVAWLNVTVCLGLLWQRRVTHLLRWLVMQIALLVVYLPWLLTQRQTGTALNTPPAPDLGLLWNIWQSYFTGIKPLVSGDRPLMILMVLFGVIGLVSIAHLLLRRRDGMTLVLLSQVVLLPVFELGIVLAANIDFHPRYFILAVPATLMMIAGGLNPRIRDRRASQHATAGARIVWPARVIVAFLAVAMLFRMASVIYSSPIFQHDDFRSIAQRYATLTEADAIIIPYGWEPTLDYYGHKMGVKARVIEIPLHSRADTIIQRLTTELAGVQRAEVLTWFQLPADVRGAYSCMLGALAEPTDDSLTTSGIKTDRYINVGRYVPLQASSVPEQLMFEGIGLVSASVRGYRGERGICLVTTWTLAARTDRDWRLVARLDHQPGWTLWQADDLLLDDRQQPTSRWQPNQPQTTFSYLPLHPGAPDGGFTVSVGMYELESGQRLTAQTQPPAPSVDGTARLAAISAAFRAQWGYPFVAGTPEQADPERQLADGFALANADAPRMVMPGETVRLTLDWRQTRPVSTALAASVTLVGEGLSASSDPCIQPHQGEFPADTRTYTLISWCVVRLPADAHGTLRLFARGWDDAARVLLASYDVPDIPRVYEAPTIALNAVPDAPAQFAGVGTFIGAQVPSVIRAGQPPEVTLVWRAGATPDVAYKVFVHLTAPDGAIIAQSDAEPVGGARPTTNWLTGEYVVDRHTLTFNQPGYRGEAKVVVGLYNPANGERVLLPNGMDRIILPLSSRVE